MPTALQSFVNAFNHLRVDRAHGIAPHKPILLISILQLIESGVISSNKIYITPELVSSFRTNWNQLACNRECKFALPFYHLKSEPFWELRAKSGYEGLLTISQSMRTFAHLNAAVEYAIIDEDLFKLATNQSANEILIQTLLDTYFHHAAFTSKNLVKGYEDQLFSLENMILNEPSEQYAREVKALIEEERQEDVFLRGSMFKREIPKIYQNTCCISRLRVDALTSVTLIDACHIVPFSESYDDTISNGIALCPNLHRAFDRGLITIDSKYRVMVSRSFIESGEHYSIKVFDGQRIQLPVEKRHYPRLENLEWHRLNKFIS